MVGLGRYQINGNADRLGIATALVAERQLRPDDERVKMAYAFCLAEESENTAARSLLDELDDRDHPMAKRVEHKLRG
jgi:hypothetical protein